MSQSYYSVTIRTLLGRSGLHLSDVTLDDEPGCAGNYCQPANYCTPGAFMSTSCNKPDILKSQSNIVASVNWFYVLYYHTINVQCVHTH